MPRDQFRLPSSPERTIRKLLLSFFVVFSFAAYVAYERLFKDGSIAGSTSSPASASDAGGPFSSQPQLGGVPTQPPSAKAVPAAPAAQAASGYKDGTYQGQPIDAYYGLVQVQVHIQHGTISSVQFLQYPNDRRTSQQINSIAMPYLQQEAIQAQSANVDIISGATLTSEGFQMSLQSALQGAHN